MDLYAAKKIINAAVLISKGFVKDSRTIGAQSFFTGLLNRLPG